MATPKAEIVQQCLFSRGTTFTVAWINEVEAAKDYAIVVTPRINEETGVKYGLAQKWKIEERWTRGIFKDNGAFRVVL